MKNLESPKSRSISPKKNYKEKYLNVFHKNIEYGTAGFRAKAEYLDFVFLIKKDKFQICNFPL